MTATTAFRQAFLDGSSQRAESVGEVAHGRYDLVVMTSSWDARSVSLVEAQIEAAHGIGVFFSNRGVLGFRDEHDPQVSAFLEQCCGQVAAIEGPSESLDFLWQQIWLAVSAAYIDVGRPLDVLLDLSTSPRYYALALFACGMRSGVLSSLTCFYAEGEYPEATNGAQEQFTEGRWETRHVPGLAGTADPGNKRLYVVSVGFEGSKTYRVVSSDDPDRVRVLFPQPGVKPEYVDRTRQNNRLLLADFGVQDADMVVAPAGDAIAAWQALALSELAGPGDNPSYLCSGTKPHALAMAIHALVEDRPTVLYAKPASHKEARTRPLGVYWSYRIDDLTSPRTGP